MWKFSFDVDVKWWETSYDSILSIDNIVKLQIIFKEFILL